jgi:opacity protein-like surface antigen
MQRTGLRQHKWLVAALGFLVTWGAITAGPALAEWTFDAYVGRAFSPDGDVDVEDTGISASADVDVDDAYIFGGRLGHWFGFFPYLGVALDASYLTTDLDSAIDPETFDDVDLRRVPLSGLAMLRLPLLPSRVVPRGHLEPYVAAGPTLFLSNLDLGDFDESREDVGLDVRAGLNFRFTRTIGIFAEYRLTYVDQEFKFTRQGVRSVVEADPSTHHVLGGLSLRF